MSRQPKIHRLTRPVAEPYDAGARFLERLRNHTQHCKCPMCCDCGKPRDERAANPYDSGVRRVSL